MILSDYLFFACSRCFLSGKRVHFGDSIDFFPSI